MASMRREAEVTRGGHATARAVALARLLLGVALVAAGLSAAPRTAVAQDAAAGRAAITRYGCVNCHAVPGFTADPHRNCVACHQEIVRRPRSGLHRAPDIRHYMDTPDLRNVTRRLRADYLVHFISDPHDVRPRLEEAMPRLPVTRADARAIVAYLTKSAGRVNVPRSPAPSRSRVAHGREVFISAGCGGCHGFGNWDSGVHLPAVAIRALGEKALLAPNLRFVRERLDPDTALAWIRSPRSIDPNAHMPRPELSPGDALAVRDFLFLGDPGRPYQPPPPLTMADLTPLDRPVHFVDVRRIFGRSCIHCHAHTTNMGTTQGLGFPGVALDLATYEGVERGALGTDGVRVSILDSPSGGGPPALLARLLRRHVEARRDMVPAMHDTLDPGVRAHRDQVPVGMPLGLPPLSKSDLRIIATWIAQGAPR